MNVEHEVICATGRPTQTRTERSNIIVPHQAGPEDHKVSTAAQGSAGLLWGGTGRNQGWEKFLSVVSCQQIICSAYCLLLWCFFLFYLLEMFWREQLICELCNQNTSRVNCVLYEQDLK